MRHLAAYLLLVVGGNSSPSAEDITTLLGAAGIEIKSDRYFFIMENVNLYI